MLWLVRMIDRWWRESMADTDPDIDTAVLHSRTQNEPSELALRAVVEAKRCLGNGEETGNNSGPWLEYIRAYAGNLPGGPWCAALISYCFVMAARNLAIDLPFKPSASAKRLTKNVGKAGRLPSVPMIGDLACWHRGHKAWQGHVGIVIATARGTFTTIEGNRGRFPSRVRIYQHEIGEPDFYAFARCP